MAKQLTLEDIKKLTEALPTKEQIEVQQYISGILDDKAKKAEAELSLIKNKGEQ